MTRLKSAVLVVVPIPKKPGWRLLFRLDDRQTAFLGRAISSLGKPTQRHSCAVTVDMSISGFAAIMPSAVSSG